MKENIQDTLNNLLTKIPPKVHTGCYHGDLFYSCCSVNQPVYIGCLLHDMEKENAQTTHHPNSYIYIIEEFERDHYQTRIQKRLKKTQKCNTGEFFQGYIPSPRVAKKHIKKGCTFLSWSKDTTIFTLINLFPEPASYRHLPGIRNEFINTDIDQKLTDIRKKIIRSPQSPKKPHLLSGIHLLKKDLHLWSLTAIYNNITEITHNTKKHMVIRFIGIYRQADRQIDIHLTLAPDSPKNTLSAIKEKIPPDKLIHDTTQKITTSHHNIDPEYILDIYAQKNVNISCDITHIIRETTNHLEEQLSKITRQKTQTN